MTIKSALINDPDVVDVALTQFDVASPLYWVLFDDAVQDVQPGWTYVDPTFTPPATPVPAIVFVDQNSYDVEPENSTIYNNKTAATPTDYNLPEVTRVPDGAEIFFKDVNGSAAASNMNIVPFAGDTIDDSALTITLSTNYDWLTIRKITMPSTVEKWIIINRS